MDVDGDGDLDFVMSGDPEEGVHVRWLENGGPGEGFVARILDGDVEGLDGGPSILGSRAVTLAADFNNDGLADLYTSGCTNSRGIGHPLNCSTGVFYEALGGGRFKAHLANGLKPVVNEWSGAAGDVDGDGLLDLFVGEALPMTNNVDLKGVHTNKLYINKGNFSFEDSGIDVDNPSTCVSTFVDVDLDGRQDLITASCNLISIENGTVDIIPGPIRLMRNTLGETAQVSFEDATESVFGKLEEGLWMGVAMADLNGDGRVDFFFGQTGDPEKSQQHLLLVSAPDGAYINESLSSGLAWHEFNWGSDFVDLDNDGDADLVTVGSLIGAPMWLGLRNPGRMFVNDGSGSFRPSQGDLGLGDKFCSGLATADYDEDGSQDVMVVCSSAQGSADEDVFTGEPGLYLFQGTARGDRHVGVALEGSDSNRMGVGALVRICPEGGGEGTCQGRVVAAGSSFASSHSPVVHFGVAEPAVAVNLSVVWPSGKVDDFGGLAVGDRYTVRESGGLVKMGIL
eukprot:evm.model.scf_1401.1 EVM.evm.TU.scf_1401.1   scf_1401:6768-11376(+)